MLPLPRFRARRPRAAARPTVSGEPSAVQAADARRPERGQALVMFILMSLVMIGAVAIVTDISWVWYGQQRMQRAADAAALAGAVYLPGDPATAYSSARAESAKNGFTDGSGGVTVTPVKDPLNGRRIIVTVTGPIGSFFARALGITQFTTGAVVACRVRAAGAHGKPRELLRRGLLRRDQLRDQRRDHHGSTQTANQQRQHHLALRPGRRYRELVEPGRRAEMGEGAYALSTSGASTSEQAWGNLGISLPTPAANQTWILRGIEVTRARSTGTAASSGCTLTTSSPGTTATPGRQASTST